MAAIDDLIAQIKGQGTTSKWTGGYGSEDAAKDMARILAGIGITDINQFGKTEAFIPLSKATAGARDLYKGVPVEHDENGYAVIGQYDPVREQTIYEPVPPNELTQEKGYFYNGQFYPESQVSTKNGQDIIKTGETGFGNKETGQLVPITYSERQTGNAWGGTFEGKGNTGYRVDFDAQGKPLFYTTGASSSDVPSWVAPALAIGGLAFGVPALGELFGGAAAGAGAAELGGLSALDAGMGAYGSGAGLLSGAGEIAASDLLAQELGADAASGLLNTSAADLTALDAGLEAYPSTGNIGGSALDAGMDVYPSTGTIEPSALDAGMNDYGTTGNVGAEVAPTASKFPLSVSDTLRAAGLVTSLVGANKLANSLGSSGSGGYDIVPIPSDWTSPIKPTGTAEFTPLAPIDFGNKEMLRGTQWEQLLSPDYGKAPAMPTMPSNPSNMTYDQLTKILGGSRESIPTANLSINDVIAGIQSQYGQAPKG